jgi:hypothetical protein
MASSKRGSAELSQYKTERGFKKMKFNFRKIATALASTAMVGSTIALAAAATFPDPFVKNGVADVVYVYGVSADLAALPDITAALNDAIQTDDDSSDVTSPTDGDFVELNKNSDKMNLGDAFNSVFGDLDGTDLTVVLGDGTYENSDGDEFDYKQDIDLGTMTLTHFQDEEDSDIPKIGFDLSDGDFVLNYTLKFTNDAEGDASWLSFETTDFSFLGKEYYILDAQTTSDGPPKLTLLDTANEATLQQGESATVAGYSVTVDFISADDAIFIVNGVEIDALQDGDTKKIAGTDAYIAVKKILYTGRESDQPRVEFSIGSGKIVLENGQEVVINDNDVSNLNVYMVNDTAWELDSMTLEWDFDGDEVGMEDFPVGTEITLPGFETISVLFSEFLTNEDTTDMFSVDPQGSDNLEVRNVPVYDGDVSFTLLQSSGSGFNVIGESSTKQLATSATTELIVDKEDDEWFVATWVSGDDAESYVLYIDDIDDNDDPDANTTIIKSRASGSNVELTLDIGETDDIGNVELTLNAASEITGTINLTIGTNGHFDRLVTENGLRFYLPVDSTAATLTSDAGLINLTAVPVSWVMNFEEEDKDDAIDSGVNFNFTIGHSSNKVTVSSVSTTSLAGTDTFETASGSDVEAGYVESDLSTYFEWDTGGDQDSVDVTYFGEETYARIFVSEAGVTSSGGSSGGTVGDINVMDSEFATHDMNTKNAIVIGGTCVNSIAAELLNVPADTCGAAWTAATGLGAGQGWIGTYDNPYATGKVATLVAGWSQGDTVSAATALATQGIDISVGKGYTVGSDNVAVAVVA